MRGHRIGGFWPARQAEANYTRPAIIVTNNQANTFAPVVTVVPLTSHVERAYPMHFLPSERTGPDRDSKAQVELLHVGKERFLKLLGTLPNDLMGELNRRLRDQLDLDGL